MKNANDQIKAKEVKKELAEEMKKDLLREAMTGRAIVYAQASNG